jgi:fused signal recognition particle receptor
MFDLFKRQPDDDHRSWSERLKAGLGASRERLARPLASVFGRKAMSSEMLDELETALISADVGIPATAHLLADLAARWTRSSDDVSARELL